MVKNPFYFILKALFVLRYLNVRPVFFSHVRKRLDKKGNVNSKVMTKTSEKRMEIYQEHKKMFR